MRQLLLASRWPATRSMSVTGQYAEDRCVVPRLASWWWQRTATV